MELKRAFLLFLFRPGNTISEITAKIGWGRVLSFIYPLIYQYLIHINIRLFVTAKTIRRYEVHFLVQKFFQLQLIV